MKLIHCADIHLDSQMNTHLDKDKAKERKLELLDTFSKMVEYAKNNRITNILIAGDLFDTKTFSAGTRNTVRDLFVSNPEINFYYLKGNHGGGDRFIEEIKDIPENLHLFGGEWCTYILSDTEERRVTLSGIELGKDNTNTVYSSLFLEPKDLNIVTLHGQISQAQTRDSGSISLPDLRNRNIDYLALGHVHEYQEGELFPNGKYCYPGCLEGRGFDECGKHGFVVVDINEQDMSISTNLIDISKRHLYEIRTDISSCMTNSDIQTAIDEAINNAGPVQKDLVKVVLTGEVDVDCEKHVDYLSKRIKEKFYFAKVKDETRIAVDYDDFMLDASLKGEFVRLVKDDDSLSDEEKSEIIRCGFQALNGEEIEL